MEADLSPSGGARQWLPLREDGGRHGERLGGLVDSLESHVTEKIHIGHYDRKT